VADQASAMLYRLFEWHQASFLYNKWICIFLRTGQMSLHQHRVHLHTLVCIGWLCWQIKWARLVNKWCLDKNKQLGPFDIALLNRRLNLQIMNLVNIFAKIALYSLPAWGIIEGCLCTLKSKPVLLSSASNNASTCLGACALDKGDVIEPVFLMARRANLSL
jgi:hypothetical protein